MIPKFLIYIIYVIVLTLLASCASRPLSVSASQDIEIDGVNFWVQVDNINDYWIVSDLGCVLNIVKTEDDVVMIPNRTDLFHFMINDEFTSISYMTEEKIVTPQRTLILEKVHNGYELRQWQD